MRSVLLVLLLVAVPAMAQEGRLTMDPTEAELIVRGGEEAALEVFVEGYTADEPYHLSASFDVDDAGTWDLRLEPAQRILGPGGDRTFTLYVKAADIPAPRELEVVVTVHAVSESFQTQDLEAVITIRSGGSDAILGRFDNPLPAPLDGDWGAFLLNVVAWLAISQLTVWVLFPLLKRIAAFTPVEEDQAVIRIINRPVFVLMFTFGLKQSLEVFALPAWAASALGRTWEVVLALAVVWVVYRLWREIILSVGKRVAAKTESELDDMLYPVFEKVGSVVILLAGLWFVVASFGVDMTLFAAGGAVVSLVIAFAAQDTLGNFFSGVFILLDRPFRVGDRIELPEQEHWGDVQEIGLRTTKVRTQDNRMVIFPNSYIGSNPVINHSYPDALYRIQVEFLLPYGSDIEYIRKTLVETTEPVQGVNGTKPVEALLLEFTPHGQKWRLRWWIDSYADTRRMFDRVNSAVIKRMGAEGIRIPYQQFTLWDAHKLLERESHGGLAPTQLTEAERRALEHEAEAARKDAEALEEAEVEEMREKARNKGDEEQ